MYSFQNTSNRYNNIGYYIQVNDPVIVEELTQTNVN